MQPVMRNVTKNEQTLGRAVQVVVKEEEEV